MTTKTWRVNWSRPSTRASSGSTAIARLSRLSRRGWAIQDHLALDGDEEKAIELKREMVAGQERVVWNPARSAPVKDFEFADADVARIKAAIESWDLYGAGTDRRWLEPLIQLLFPTQLQ